MRTAAPLTTTTPAELDELGLWLLNRCAFRDRSWTDIAALQRDCSGWCAAHRWPMPASRRAFVDALQAEGFTVTADGWCYGLLLKEDLTPHEEFHAVPEFSKQPELITAKRRWSWRSG